MSEKTGGSSEGSLADPELSRGSLCWTGGRVHHTHPSYLGSSILWVFQTADKNSSSTCFMPHTILSAGESTLSQQVNKNLSLIQELILSSGETARKQNHFRSVDQQDHFRSERHDGMVWGGGGARGDIPEELTHGLRTECRAAS